MKKIVLLAFCFVTLLLHAQDVVIGNAPNLLAHGNLIVSQPLKSSSAAPTAAQILTMTNGATVQFSVYDSVGRLFDPGGVGNYAANQTAVCNIPANQAAFEVTLEDVDLRTGDSLIIRSRDTYGPNYFTLLAVGNGYSTRGTFTFDNVSGNYYLEITFISNADNVVGRGFSLLFKRLFTYSSYLPLIYPSQSLVYNAAYGALRSGYTGTQAMGYYSAAFGSSNTASGYAALSSGSYNNASGYSAIAGGYSNTATGTGSVALGYYTQAAGTGAAAVGGYGTYARGNYSFATGYGGYAHADYSFAAGYNAAATGNVASAFGEGTLSASYVCMSLGRYNYTTPTSSTGWVATDPVLIVGNGTDGNHRSNILEFYKNGNLGIRGSYYSFSDARLKTDIKPLENSLEKIQSINGYNYHWKSKDIDPGLQTGVLAQEIEKSFPELVGKNLKGELAVNYIGLIPHLIEAIKELRKEISDIKNDTSSSIAICLCDKGVTDNISASPNPVTNQLTVTLTTTTPGDGYVQLMSSSGQVLQQNKISVREGSNLIHLSFPKLAAGEYQVVVKWGTGMMRKVSIIKQ